MNVSKQRKAIEQKRAETLDEIAKLQSMTKNRDIFHGLNWMRLGLLKRWEEKRPNKSTPEQVAKNFQASQQRTMHGKNRGSKWNEDDARLVLDAEVSDEEIALMLGRTTQAVRRKRAKLTAPNAKLTSGALAAPKPE